MEPISPYSHKPPTSPPKPKQPEAITAIKAGLHPNSKTVQALSALNNKKKGS